jgi:hypothetical protein
MRFAPTLQDVSTARLFASEEAMPDGPKSGPRHLQGISPSWRLDKGKVEIAAMFQTAPAVGFSLQSFDPSAKQPALAGF